ncbi:hypothetical protein BV20DRAFT_341423 [Pilatotrama ljubarskyi]|nr:hypothetical protein BV20DRAFT_341423 [Pilatotrama ljubarskyi]
MALFACLTASYEPDCPGVVSGIERSRSCAVLPIHVPHPPSPLLSLFPLGPFLTTHERPPVCLSLPTYHHIDGPNLQQKTAKRARVDPTRIASQPPSFVQGRTRRRRLPRVRCSACPRSSTIDFRSARGASGKYLSIDPCGRALEGSCDRVRCASSGRRGHCFRRRRLGRGRVSREHYAEQRGVRLHCVRGYGLRKDGTLRETTGRCRELLHRTTRREKTDDRDGTGEWNGMGWD